MKKIILLSLIFLILSLFISKTTFAAFEQQGSKLVGTGAVGTTKQGYSVSISSDGNTAIVGGYGDDSYKGAAWIFTRTDGVWSQQGSKLVGTGVVGDDYVYQAVVSISSDGNTAIVGGAGDDSNKGAAWIFTRTDGVWSQQGSKLVGIGAVGVAGQGRSVSLSADGNTAIVGGNVDDSYKGAAWIFTRTDGVWSQQGSKLVGTGAVGAAFQGYSVDLSSDGNTAIVGGYLDNSSKGAVWIYTRTDGIWSQQGSRLVGTGAVGGAYQGKSVSISSDGNTAIVGGTGDDFAKGAVWIYTRTDGIWSQQGNKLVGTGITGTYAEQGQSVSISSVGNTAIVGGISDDSEKGATWIFTYVNSNDATITSGEYTISTIGGGAETITDVPFGTSKADFLANLTKGYVNQTWNDTDISDPVLTGDTLVVTAEDGMTVITYTVTVLPEPSHDATITSGVYTVGTGGGANRTITNVPFATSQSDFLDNLTKSYPNQTWDYGDNEGNVNDPVQTGDTLIVWAEDETTTITYTITTLSDPGVDIDTCAEFEDINNALYRTYRLTTDLDCTSEGNNIMVGVNDYFTGNFDGQNHTITIAINARSSSNVGLFGQANRATISNLTIAGVVHGGEGGYDYAGVLIGYGTDLTISNIISTASISGNHYVGGLIGYLGTDNSNSTVDDSSVSGNVSGIGNYVGGLIGYMYTERGDITITNSHSSRAIDGNAYVGGLIGRMENYSEYIITISNSYSTSSVIGYNDSVGGLVGYIYEEGNSEENDRTAVNILNSYHTTGNIFEGNGGGGGQSVGGIVGDVYLDYRANFTLSDSYASGSISNTSGYAGGLIGNLVQGDDLGYGGNINILRNHSSGTVSTGTSSYAGGLIGYFSFTMSESGLPSTITINNNYSTADVSGSYDLGGIVGYLSLENYTEQPLAFTFNQNHASGTITGGGSQGGIGGLVGFLNVYDDYGDQVTGTLDQDYFTGTILENNGGSNYYGGLIGYLAVDNGNPFTISNSYSTANVTGYSQVGGLIGSSGIVNITDSYATGSVTGYSEVGGLVGYSFNTDLTNSYATGNVIASNINSGGLVGTNLGNSVITNSYAIGNVTSESNAVGGLAGSNLANATITKSYAAGNIIGDSYVGGLVGINRGTITDVYAKGNVTGSNQVGGLLGINRGPLTNGYAVGLVTGDSEVGGLVGFNNSNNGGSVTNSFYDELTGQTDEGKGVLTTTVLMKTETNFTDEDWDFEDIWGIDTTLVKNSGYPYLQWESYPSATVASPTAGTYSDTQTITLTATGSTSIRYSTLATPADCSSGTLYTAPLSVSESQTIYTRACNSIGNSTPKSFVYTISRPSGGGGGGSSYIPPVVIPPASNTPIICLQGQIFSTTTGQRCTSWEGNTNSSRTYNFGNTTLRLGSRGEAVKELQRFLNDTLNLGLVIDGKLGPKTIVVIKKWQKEHGLTPDGMVGKRTKAVMLE